MVRQYEIDSCGDVVLELWPPQEPFAPWTPDLQTWPNPKEDNSQCTFHFHDVDPALKMDDCVSVDEDIYDVRHDEEAVESPAIIHDRVAYEPLDPSSGTDASAEVPAFAESPPMMNADGNPATDQNEELASEPAARFLLSSKHLTLASPYFKTTLGGVWRETRIKSSSELLTTLKGFDVDATLILMQIIHGQLHETPTAVTLELLAKISVLVDYLECHQAFRFVSRTWFAEMTVSPPDHYGRELVLWILISKVFSEPKIFETTTKTAIISSYGRLQTMELPLPNALIDAMETSRQDAVRRTIKLLYDLRQYLSGNRARCKGDCSQILLGDLSAHMMDSGIRELQENGSTGCSFKTLATVVSGWQSSTWDLKPSRYENWTKHSCSLSAFLLTKLKEVEKYTKGLSLEDFPNHQAR